MSILIAVALVLSAGLGPLGSLPPATPITVSFDDISGVVAMSNVPGSVVPNNAKLSTQLQPSTGAVFRSESGEAYVPIVAASPVPSEPNAIGGAGSGGVLDYHTTVIVEFFLPGSPSVKAVTDFVSITTDLKPIEPITGQLQDLTLMAFDVSGALLGSDTTMDVAPGGFILSVSSSGIHSIKLVEEGTTNAWDELSFSPVSCQAVVATESVRLGTPPNPAALLPGVTSGPVLGATWDPVIDHTTFLPGSVLDILVMSGTPTNIPISIGTLLCGATPFLTLTSSPGTPFALSLPNDCNLAGVSLCTQGAGIDGALDVALTNALDITLGSY